MEIRRSYDRLISIMGFPILVRWHLYIESGTRAPADMILPCLVLLEHCIAQVPGKSIRKKFFKGNDEVYVRHCNDSYVAIGVESELQQWKIWHKCRTALSTTGVSYTVINIKYCDVITHQCHNFNGCLAKPPLELGMAWVITSHIKLQLCNIPILSCLKWFTRWGMPADRSASSQFITVTS